jgi:hypothetical protein
LYFIYDCNVECLLFSVCLVSVLAALFQFHCLLLSFSFSACCSVSISGL